LTLTFLEESFIISSKLIFKRIRIANGLIESLFLLSGESVPVSPIFLEDVLRPGDQLLEINRPCALVFSTHEGLKVDADESILMGLREGRILLEVRPLCL
jgi:hypothetical protein